MRRFLVGAFVLVAVSAATFAGGSLEASAAGTAGTISTIAGDGSSSFCGDNGPATAACLHSPGGVAVDAAGDVYVADTMNNRVRKIDTDGVITTVAGGYGPGSFCGDGGPAAAACLNSPSGVTFDKHGNLFIADSGNNRIRKIDADGVITTVAGKSSPRNCRIGKQATRACLHFPRHVVFDRSGNMYIADYYSGHVWKVAHSGRLTAFAGGGSGAACGDDGIPATSACLGEVTDVAIDASGNVYVADLLHYKLRRVDTSGTITTLAGNGTYGYCGENVPATSVCLGPVEGLVVPRTGGVLFNSDDRIMTVDSGGILRSLVGGATTTEQPFCGDGGPATAACLESPAGIALNRRGDLFIADQDNERIRKVVAPFGP